MCSGFQTEGPRLDSKRAITYLDRVSFHRVKLEGGGVVGKLFKADLN